MADLLIHEHKKNDTGSYDNVYRKTKAKIVETEDGGTAEQKFSDMASHISSKENPHSVTAEQAGADPAGSATQALNDAKSYTDQKISQIPTPDVSGQIAEHNASPEAHSDIREALNGKETAGAATAVQSKLDAHIADKNNPHGVTAVQIGADPAGSSATVQSNLDAHIQNKQNPHGVTADQVGARPNSWTPNATEVGADPAGSAAQALQDAKTYTDQQIEAIPTPDVSGQINAHNTSSDAHANMGWITSDDGLPDEPALVDADTLGGVVSTDYATKAYVDSAVGDIGALLDSINGEVV